IYKCDDSMVSCATSPDGEIVFGGDSCSSVYCFDTTGKRLWKLATGCDSALSMQYHDGKVYIVTSDGTLACIDASQAAIKAAEAGSVPKAKEIKAPASSKPVAPSKAVATTKDTSKGVLLECVQDSGRPRVRVLSKGYHHDWWVQFPRDIREVGA